MQALSCEALWEQEHASRRWGEIPSVDLARFVKTHYSDVDRGSLDFLDIGCGIGAQSVWLARQGINVTAIDISASAIEQLRAITGRRGLSIKSRVADIVNLAQSGTSFHNNTLDCVVDVCAIQHLTEVCAFTVIRAAGRWLKPGGRIFSIMAADLGNREGGPLGLRLASKEQVVKMFDGYSKVIDLEFKTRECGLQSYSHWIIEAQVLK